MPKVSVLTPTYDHARYVDECVTSVLGQSFQDWEMVVVDDGSTDGTPDVVGTYGDPRIRIIRRPHGGIERLAETYNAGLAECQGEYVAILEGDDFWPPDKLERQIPLFDDPEVVLVSGRTSMVDEDGHVIGGIPEVAPTKSERENRPIGSASLALLHPSHLTFTFPVSTVLRRDVLIEAGGFRSSPELPVVDLPTFVALGQLGAFGWVDAVCGCWRRHGASTTSGNLPLFLDGAYRLALEHCATASQGETPRRAALLEAWSSFMTHRFVLLSVELLEQGDRQGAFEASRIAATFGGPLKRRLKSVTAQIGVRLGLKPGWIRTMTHTDAGPRLNRFESLVDRSMLDRARTM